MRLASCLVMALLTLVVREPASARADEKLDATWKALAGSWVVVGNTPNKGIELTFGKDKVSMSQGGQSLEMKCELDTSVTPNAIDVMPTGGKKEDNLPMRGIFKIEGDTLTICWGVGTFEAGPDGQPKRVAGKRPTEFSSEDAELTRILMTLNRK